MKGYWSETRANGQPLESGTVCWVTDLEDGTHPIFTYGHTQEEVLEKLARQNANAQLALARRASAAAQPPAAAPGGRVPPPAAPRQISADQIMQATADLQNPAKAADAVSTLVESATGMSLVDQARRNYALLALHWEENTPEFYGHPGNRQLLGNRAIKMAGGRPGAVTEAMLTEAFKELQAEGMLFEAPEEPAQQQPATLTTFPGENPVQRTERPRGTRFATGARSTSFSAAQTAPTRTLKYTEEQIRTMPLAKQRELIERNDPDYAAACEAYYGQARATA